MTSRIMCTMYSSILQQIYPSIQIHTPGFVFCLMLILKISMSSTQDSEDYLDTESLGSEHFNITNKEPLILNESYCLESISAQVLCNTIYNDSYKSLYYISIMWNSKHFMTSIKVESDSVNDSYCESENKHYYNRKPLNQSFHVFPDDVNEGIRFLPIKLDCKYIITPELEGFCQPIKLRYSTPVCINNETCTCRNIIIPGPILEVETINSGLNIFWSFPDDFKNSVSNIVFLIYSEDGLNVKKILKRKVSIDNLNITNKFMYKELFEFNVTEENSYRIQGYFENKISCPGNSTFLRFRHSAYLSKIKYQNVISYTVAFIFLFFIILIGLVFLWKQPLNRICMKLFRVETTELKDYRKIKHLPLPKLSPNLNYVEDLYWFDYRDLVIGRKIASGNFGVVHLAYSTRSLKGFNEFAIKQIKDSPGLEADFLEEIEMFKQVGSHPNVVEMLGYCGPPYPLTIIMEYVPHNLLFYLKHLRAKFEREKQQLGSPISYAELSHSRSSINSSLQTSLNSSNSTLDCIYLSQRDVKSHSHLEHKSGNEIECVLDHKELEVFGLQIAKGMAYLESKRIVHRDLAARNVLMNNFKILKICDFGMSKNGVYVNKRSKKFPLRWMSPEALINRTFSNKSDIWSFGVVLWEIGTLGAFPYPNLQNEEVILLLQKGGHLDKPENVTNQFYELMVECWAWTPDQRPTFKDLVEKIEGFCQKSNGYVEFENLKSNYVFPPMEEDVERKKETVDDYW